MAALTTQQTEAIHQRLEQVLYELKKVIVGQEHLLERLLIAVIARGHVLVEGPPGLAKTLTLKSLAKVMSVQFKRIQFTPDLLPADLIGTRIFQIHEDSFKTEFGPLFSHFVLADEINRAPAKVQSALLEAMEEKQVTIGRETFILQEPFLVMATQNPIESEGTYPLPEAQLDRFLFKLLVTYPDHGEETTIIQRMSLNRPPDLSVILERDWLMEMSQWIHGENQGVYVDPKIVEYIVHIVQATRGQTTLEGLQALKPWVQYGASPRGTLALTNASKALALIRGRNYVVPDDVTSLIHDCLRHRLIISYEGLAKGITPDYVLTQIQSAITPPQLTTLSS